MARIFCLARAAVALTVLTAFGLAQAANWPNWRGPSYTGASSETGIPAAFSETKNLAWKRALPGPSSATPIMWENRVFLSSTNHKTNDLLAMCLDARTGEVLWQHKTGQDRRWPNNNMACPSPVTDGKAVFFHYGTGELVAFDLDGKLLWERDLQKDYGPFIIKWGHSASPTLTQGRLYVPVFQNTNPTRYNRPYKHKPDPADKPLESYFLAIDPATGETLWKHVRPTDATDESTEAYNTLIPYEGAGRAELIVVAAEYVTGHDPATGRELWRWEFVPSDRKVWQRVVTSAVPGDRLIYATRPKHRALFALKDGAEGRAGSEVVAWSFPGPHVPDASTPLLYRGRLYVQDGDKKVITCLDAKTGEQVWQGRLGGRRVYRASPLGVDGKVYCMNDAAEVVVLAAGEEFKVLSRIPLKSAPSRSSLSVSHGRLFIRTARALYCVKAPTASEQ
jgi:outer membrane protein assembly factor BamB